MWPLFVAAIDGVLLPFFCLATLRVQRGVLRAVSPLRKENRAAVSRSSLASLHFDQRRSADEVERKFRSTRFGRERSRKKKKKKKKNVEK